MDCSCLLTFGTGSLAWISGSSIPGASTGSTGTTGRARGFGGSIFRATALGSGRAFNMGHSSAGEGRLMSTYRLTCCDTRYGNHTPASTSKPIPAVSTAHPIAKEILRRLNSSGEISSRQKPSTVRMRSDPSLPKIRLSLSCPTPHAGSGTWVSKYTMGLCFSQLECGVGFWSLAFRKRLHGWDVKPHQRYRQPRLTLSRNA